MDGRKEGVGRSVTWMKRRLLGTGRKFECLGALVFGVEVLEDRDRDGRGVASAGLGLRDDDVHVDDAHDGRWPLLESQRELQTAWPVNTRGQCAWRCVKHNSPVSIDTTKELGLFEDVVDVEMLVQYERIHVRLTCRLTASVSVAVVGGGTAARVDGVGSG